MARHPRRTHSVSGPPSAHCVLKDVSCCCNMGKIHQFYMSVMALRRNPQRKCKKEDEQCNSGTISDAKPDRIGHPSLPLNPLSGLSRPTPSRMNQRGLSGQFRFCDLPREVRDHVYSYLVVRRGKKLPIFESRAILRAEKKRAIATRNRERLNQKRLQNGRRPISAREHASDCLVHLNVLQTSRQLHLEGTDHLYQSNWFAISLDSFPATTIEIPSGWHPSRITKMQLELQLKDTQRMNSYVDWGTFFSSFPSLRFVHIIPTFHPRYYDWARTELTTWATAHYIFRAFFRELLASIPVSICLKLGPSLDPEENMQLEGRGHVSRKILEDMYAEVGMRRGVYGGYLPVNRVVECRRVSAE
ncbi:uncharacterized protein EI97DRAFT_437509 [Westerdykella ornata]|uniref:Uncharacterized protein n=1 Tax=Westerdykella ornata TaxID=318751 RepID=A0A6A6J5W4_WESOR|nr:uncharacterized protein EI97DRAFT_437509 [Westerdykella ornata]KAF2271825.1 hypothetical protein EI97DRAFT_437509 [Westerdykella ornata]